MTSLRLGAALLCALMACKSVEINGADMSSGDGGAATSTAPRCDPAEQVVMNGRVTEEALGGTAGDPIANVEIQSTPTISNVDTTDADGAFSTAVACDARHYSLTAHKLGYVDRTLEATADVKVIDLAFTMVRDDNYRFVTITVLDATSSEPLEGALVTTAAVGAEANFATTASGTLSYPFPAASTGAMRLSVTKQGYGAVVGDYDVGASTFQQISGKGTGAATAGGLTVTLVKS